MADQGKNLINQTDKLLAEIKKSNSDFDKKTSKIVSDADKTVKELDKMDLDRELGRVEKNAVREMDAAVLDFLSGEEKEEE